MALRFLANSPTASALSLTENHVSAKIHSLSGLKNHLLALRAAACWYFLGGYFTSIGKLSLWLLNSGAYMHWMLATPVWYLPRN